MQAQPSRPPYLFYSPKCPHCQQLIEMIKRNQTLAKRIEPINIHTTRSLPPQLEGVPAILFAGQLLVGPDTFKWVQFQQPQQEQRRDEDRPAMNGGPGMGLNAGSGQDEVGIPLPSDISSDTKHGIDFTPLPGQEDNKVDPTIPRFAYLPGQNSQSDGTVGIDIVAASDVASSQRGRANNGIAQQYEQLQKLRGMDNERLAEQQGGSGGYNYARQGANSQQSMQGQAYNDRSQGAYMQPGQGQQGGQQGGYMQGGGQGMPQGMQGGGQGGYEMQTGQRGGYSTMYQQQANPYQADALPKRW